MSIQPPPSSYPREISVTEPLMAAYERMKRILFSPFDLGKWFVIGFCAWLAGLGESGGYGGNYGNYSGGKAHPLEEFRHVYGQAHDYVMLNLVWLLPVVFMVLVIGLGLCLLILWLNSRGKFMFLHCVALNRSEIEIPWDKYGGAANRLFWFRLLLSLASMVFFLPLLVVMGIFIVRLLLADNPNFAGFLPVMGLGSVMFLLGVGFALIHLLLVDFVVPIMYLRGQGCRAAWREVLRLISEHAGDLILYVLFKIVLAVAIWLLLLFVVLFTCCVAGCVMWLPYIGAVFLLPVSIFKRSYSLYYLAQFGPQYNVFLPDAPPASNLPPPGLRPL